MDYDADGRVDVISGSYTGELYLFHRQKDGTLEQGVRIKGRDGKDLKVSYSVTPEMVDMDADGDLDLVVGTRTDAVHVFRNDGTRGKPVWNPEPKQLKTRKGEVIKGSNAHHADWDGDGVRDLILGSELGGVRWYRNAGRNDRPQYEAGRELVKARPGSSKPEGTVPTGPGSRTKVHVTDWNGDGLADLLVGDVQTQVKKGPPLTDEEKKEKAALEPRFNELRNQMGDLLNEIWRLEKEKKPVPEELRKRKAELRKAYDPYAKKMGRFEKDEHIAHGWVWLFLRQPTTRGG